MSVEENVIVLALDDFKKVKVYNDRGELVEKLVYKIKEGKNE